MRLLLLLALTMIPAYSQCGEIDFVNEQVVVETARPVQAAKELKLTPQPSPEIETLRELAEKIRADGEAIQQLVFEIREMQENNPPPLRGAGFVVEQNSADTTVFERRLSQVEKRMDSAEGRIDSVEKQLKAIITVQKKDGTKADSTVQIDTVAGYGQFEVPVGGYVTHINGIQVRKMQGQAIYQSGIYQAAQVPRTRTMRLSPTRFFRNTCTIDPVTGMKICPQ